MPHACAGHRVLLLEHHNTIGGLTQSFSRNGFRWDVGIHYQSSFAPGDRMADLLNGLCDSPIPL
ncbi:MAG: NAD(P)-binding protein [Pseudomonadota bacterium]